MKIRKGVSLLLKGKIDKQGLVIIGLNIACPRAIGVIIRISFIINGKKRHE